MGKRFTDSDKWSDVWFRQLPPLAKLFWVFLLDKCDCAGFWKTDYELASFLVGKSIDESILAHFEGRIEKINGDKLWIVKFVDFQYGLLREEVSPHRPVVKILAKYGLLERVQEDFLNPSKSKGYGKGYGRVT